MGCVWATSATTHIKNDATFRVLVRRKCNVICTAIHILRLVHPANTKHVHNIYTTSGERFLDVGLTLYKCYTIVCVFAGYL